MSPLTRVLLSVLLLAPAVAQAAAGQVLFALGRVEIQRGTQVLPAVRGGAVEAGDVISTGPTGMTQVRMQDGALLSLRHGSTMKVEEYQAPAPVVAAPAGVAPAASAPASGGRTVLRLLRGAFRTVTGLIGRNAGDTYSVITPVATIGIRGTDYSAAYCSGDCGTTPDGLYLGVSNGGIEVSNDAGKLELANDQYGYVKDATSAPGRELVPPDVLDAPTPPEGEGDRDETEADEGVADSGLRDDTRDVSVYETGQTQPDSVGEARAVAGRYAFSSGSFKDADLATVYIDGRGDLIGFSGGATRSGAAADIGTAANFDTGADSATGLRWGRWHGGMANVASDGATGGLDLTSASLHWIYAVGSDGPVLAITGTRNYTLVGGTNPTDNTGAVGVLGGATLFADFTNQLVNTSVDVAMPNAAGGTSQWQASGQGSITSGTFQGVYSVVLIDGQVPGSGGFAGFFTSDASGAGLTFELTDTDFVTTINGVAAFAEVAGQSPAGGP
jgi:hypothetical protein